jgi:hypothetical protein
MVQEDSATEVLGSKCPSKRLCSGGTGREKCFIPKEQLLAASLSGRWTRYLNEFGFGLRFENTF